MILLKNEPMSALEFIADFDKEESLKHEHPSIYSNILVNNAFDFVKVFNFIHGFIFRVSDFV